MPILFILIESGMALSSTQFARLVVTIMNMDASVAAFYLTAGIHQMLNVIISKISHCYVISLITWASLGYYTYHYPGAGINGIVFPR